MGMVITATATTDMGMDMAIGMVMDMAIGTEVGVVGDGARALGSPSAGTAHMATIDRTMATIAHTGTTAIVLTDIMVTGDTGIMVIGDTVITAIGDTVITAIIARTAGIMRVVRIIDGAKPTQPVLLVFRQMS
jgi:hypothetical protein